MSNNNKKRSFRERRENRGEIPETLTKKHHERRKSDGDTSQREDGMVPEEELLDPVAEARKALEMFQEVSGETITHIIPKKDENRKTKSEVRHYEHRYLDQEGDSGELHSSHTSTNGKIPKKISQKRKLEGGLKRSERDEGRTKATAVEKKKAEEEKARQKKRIEDGEARRREFRPKIARLQDSNCLL